MKNAKSLGFFVCLFFKWPKPTHFHYLTVRNLRVAFLYGLF